MNSRVETSRNTRRSRVAVNGIPVLLAFAVTLGGLGCATEIPGISRILPSANPSEEIELLANDVQTARDEGLDVLSPTWFGVAADAVDEARDGLGDGESVQSILRQVAEGRAALEQAKTFGDVAQKTLPDVIKARDDAREAGAESLGSTYQRVEDRFLELTAAVESDSLRWARRTAPDVEKDFRLVELASIKSNTVDRIVDLIAKAREAGAARYAPESLADVERRSERLDRFISENRYASDEMGQRANELLFHANRLVHLTEDAKRLEGLRPNQLALQSEALLASFREKLGLPDLRNRSQAAQRREIENAIDALNQNRLDLQTSVAELRTQAASQEGRIVELRGVAERERERLAALEADRAFNQRFAEVSALFDSGEAEVYKKGSQLVIRVRSIQFPVGSAVVLPESYPVLAKVQKAIQSFEQPRVVVEGHTDSTGSAEVNDRVSQARADAVEAYLVNNATIEAARVSAVGKGFSVPLASDRTAEGRAQNRRIDVVIDAAGAEVKAQQTTHSNRS